MKQNVKRLMSILLAGCLLLSCLAGCGKENPDPTEPETQTQGESQPQQENASEPTAEPESDEPITITIGSERAANGWPEKVEDDFVRTAIFEKTNVWVDLVKIDEYYTSLNVQLVGGTAPDFFEADRMHMVEYAEQGLIKPIDEYRPLFEDLLNTLGDEYDNFTLYAGSDNKMYAFPKAQAQGDQYYGYFVRKDIIDKYYDGKIPATIDELYDFCVKMVQQDVVKDTTGQATIGLGGKNFYTFNLIAAAYGTLFGNYVIVENGKVSNTLFSEHMKEALTAAKKFYDAGVMSPNIFAGSEGVREMRAGQAVAGVAQWSTVMKQSYMNDLHAVAPEGEWAYGQPLKPEVDGVEPFLSYVDYNFNKGPKYVVNESTSDEKIEAMCKVLNYLATEEGSMLSWMGIEGTHWTRDENGDPYVIEGQDEAINYIHDYQLIGRNDPEYLKAKFPEAEEVAAYGFALPRLVKYNEFLDVPTEIYLEDLNKYVESELLNFINGTRSIDDYDKFIEELKSSYHLEEYMQLAEDQLKAGGIIP